jgi:hypothetical protein
MWSRSFKLLLIFFVMSFTAQAQIQPTKREPLATEIERIRIHADSLRTLLLPNKYKEISSADVAMQYLNVFDYFIKSHELIAFSQKSIKLILGKADTNFVLSRFNNITVWQYGKVFTTSLRTTQLPVYRFYFDKSQLISVTRVEE